MSFVVRVLIRYWFIVPILLIVTVLQLGLGFAVVDRSTKAKDSELAAGQENSGLLFQSQVQQPTLTRVPTFTATPKPSPTATPTPTSTFPALAHSTDSGQAHSVGSRQITIETAVPGGRIESNLQAGLPAEASTPSQADKLLGSYHSTKEATATPTPSTSSSLSRELAGQADATSSGQASIATATSNTPTNTPTPTVVLSALTAQDYTAKVPILMYHYLSAPPPGANAIRLDLSVSPARFESHLAYLRQAGYQTISFTQLAYAAAQQAALPPKPIIITFDDGYRDHYRNAFPLLQEYGYTATFFIFTQPVQTANVDYLSWDMVTEMHQAGMEFGSHSHTHPDLRGRDIDFLINEIVTSKQMIEDHIGEPIRVFCYPAGRYDALTIQVVKSAGFWGAVTTKWGARHSLENRFEMPRVRVRGQDTAKDLAQKLNSF